MSILLFFIILFVLVLVHELGHFLIAKRAGIRVDEFGIGFPPRLFGKKIGETLYSFNLLPIGGFVKIFGENPSEEATSGSDSERSFVNKSKWAQIAVLFGGVLFNVLFAWVLFTFGFLTGIPASPNEYPNAKVSDLKVVIGNVIPASPAGEAGVASGSEIVGIMREGVVSQLSSEKISQFIREGGEFTLITERAGERSEYTLVPKKLEGVEGQVIGIQLAEVGIVTLPWYGALYEGARTTLSSLALVTVAITNFIIDAFTLNANLQEIAGPVGIVSLVGDAGALGFAYLISFTAFISLNLAVINLLPFPALDGGRIVFVIIEAIKGSPIRASIVNTANGIGFILLILLIIAVTYNDILRLL
ncbi:MAG: site-2 protease family protein [Candidatus Paceibacterota bacterium]